MLTIMAGPNIDFPIGVGTVWEPDDELAQSLIDGGYAIEVIPEPEEDAEEDEGGDAPPADPAAADGDDTANDGDAEPNADAPGSDPESGDGSESRSPESR